MDEQKRYKIGEYWYTATNVNPEGTPLWMVKRSYTYNMLIYTEQQNHCNTYSEEQAIHDAIKVDSWA